MPESDPLTVPTIGTLPDDLERFCPGSIVTGQGSEGKSLRAIFKATNMVAKGLGRCDFGPTNRFINLELNGLQYVVETPYFRENIYQIEKRGLQGDILIRFSAGYAQPQPDDRPPSLPFDPAGHPYILPEIPIDVRNAITTLVCRMASGGCDFTDPTVSSQVLADVLLGVPDCHFRRVNAISDPCDLIILDNWPVSETVYVNEGKEPVSSGSGSGSGSDGFPSDNPYSTISGRPRAFKRDCCGEFFRDTSAVLPGTNLPDPDYLVDVNGIDLPNAYCEIELNRVDVLLGTIYSICDCPVCCC